MIRILAPGIDCETVIMPIACNVATAVIERIYNDFQKDVMTIHDGSGNCLSEISVKEDKVCFCILGRQYLYEISNVRQAVFDLIRRNI